MQQKMLQEIGYQSFDDLFHNIPSDLKCEKLGLEAGMSEMEVYNRLLAYAKENHEYQTIFRGAGSYQHYIPSALKQIVSKEEFVSAYTPYQAEISQGVLQSIFEYQTMMCELSGLDVSNASIYDGASAAAEGLMMCKERNRNKILVSKTAHPFVLETIQTYAKASDTELQFIEAEKGQTSLKDLKAKLDDSVCGVYVASPNFYGIIEECETISQLVHENKSKFVMSFQPIASAILPSPNEVGADIAVAEGQPLGMSMGLGGPYLGIMTCTNALMRKLPGRIVGQTVDSENKVAYVLTLQAREQHIRREKASSNVCSNEAHCALTASVYLALLGKSGLEKVARSCCSNAHYLQSEMAKIGMPLAYAHEYFHEFVTEVKDADKILSELRKHQILGGYPLNQHQIIWCTTEMNTLAEMDQVISILKEVA